MSNNFPLFIPISVKTYTNSSNLLTNEKIRLEEARKAFSNIVREKYFRKIVIVTSDNTNFLERKEIKRLSQKGIQIEQLRFQQNKKQVSKNGKSNGEVQITNFMVKNSKFVKFYGGFYKLSGRYNIKNLGLILEKIKNQENVFFYYHPFPIRKIKASCCTIFYKCSLKFYLKYLYNAIQECSTEKNGFLEYVFFRKIHRLNTKKIKVNFPFFEGIAGTTAKPIENRYFTIRNILSRVGLICFSFDEHKTL
jgi:hypothetical protein